MENSQTSKIVAELIREDVRQSQNWLDYLRFFGWKIDKTETGIPVVYRKTIFTNSAKIQRPKNLTQKDIEAIDEFCKENRVGILKLEPRLTQNLQVLAEDGFQKSHFPLLAPATIIFNLTLGEETLWNNISKSGKYSIRRGYREDAKVEFYQNPSKETQKQFHDLTLATQKKRGFHAITEAQLENKVKIFKENCWIGIVKNAEDTPVAGSLYVTHNQAVWFLHGGTSNRGRHGKEGYVLMWEAIKHFKGLGMKALDLDGRDDDRFPHFTKNWGRFSYFKEKFGGMNVYFPEPYGKIYTPILSWLNKFYKLPL